MKIQQAQDEFAAADRRLKAIASYRGALLSDEWQSFSGNIQRGSRDCASRIQPGICAAGRMAVIRLT